MKAPLLLAAACCAGTLCAQTPPLRLPHEPPDFSHRPQPPANRPLPEEKPLPEPPHRAHADAESPADETEQQINQALLEKNWPLLADLLAAYRQQAGRDAILHAYAHGAWLRHHARYPEAIAQYRAVLEQQPDLAYPRFDYGVMLFENRQYREAETQLAQAKPHIQPAMQQLADAYLAEIRQRQSWRPAANLYYARTDNVNNAASAREIHINGARFIKSPDALPQSAHGIGYGLGLAREVNTGGNHFAAGHLHYGGIHYRDQAAYNEQSLHLEAGYRRRSHRDTWGILPFAAHHRLGGSPYSKLFGLRAEYGRRFSHRLHLATEWTHTRKHYAAAETARRFNGFAHSAHAVLTWQAEPAWLLHAGIEISREHARDAAESSRRYGLRGGVAYHGNGLGSSLHLHYARRRFEAEHFLYGQARRDHEYRLLWRVWHRRLAWRGMVPKLNFRYQKTASNLPELYSRSGGSWFMTLEKVF